MVPSADLTAVRTNLDGLTRAIADRDQAAFTALTSTADSAFADRVRLLYANLTALDLAELRFRPAPPTRPLSAAREQLLGERAWVQSVMVEWRLTGEAASADQQLWMTFIDYPGGVRLAGTIDGPTEPAQLPLWWLGPTTEARSGAVTVLAGPGQQAAQWRSTVDRAAEEVRSGLPPSLSSSWDGTVVVEVPGTERDFEAVLGVPADTRRGSAAVTQIEGSADSATIRVVVNPRITEVVTAGDLPRVLAHEIVHVATQSPQSAAPDWAIEGLAEWVSLRDHPKQQSWGTDQLLTEVRNSGAPRALPGADQFSDTEPTRLRIAYAQSWLVSRYVAEKYSIRQLGDFYTALDRGDPLDDAAQATLGRSERQLTAGWRDYLDDLAGR